MGTTYNDIKDLLKAIAICESIETKARLINQLHESMKLERNQRAILHPNTKWEIQKLAEKVGLRLIQTRVLTGFEFVHVATTPPPKTCTYIYIPEPKSDMLVGTLLANLQGRML